jgi:hypothetical protein
LLGRRLAVLDLARRDIDDELGELGGGASSLVKRPYGQYLTLMQIPAGKNLRGCLSDDLNG